MQIRRWEVSGLAHYSYLIASHGLAAVVDPRRDVDGYLECAAARGWKITHVVETHIHADYASGARELAERAGAELCLSAHDQGEQYRYQFPHRSLRHGDRIRVGDVELVALHTPGHTPEHLCFLLPPPQPAAPVLLSGDFLLVGSLGRPDLLGAAATRRLAEMLYASVHGPLRELPDDTLVLPAHGADSLCGSGIAAQPLSTLGRERITNRFLNEADREAFVQCVLAELPPRPAYFARMKQLNAAGPPLLGTLPGGQALSPQECRRTIEQEDAIVVDLRGPDEFAAAHLPGAINVPLGRSFVSWAAWVLPCDRPLLLVGAGADDQQESARRALVRVGLDGIRGVLVGGVAAWQAMGWPLETLEPWEPDELAARPSALVVDVRSPAEWQAGHIPDALHIPCAELVERLAELPREASICAVCASGMRSSMAASLLRRAGFTRAGHLAGGMEAWQKRGLPVLRPA